MSCGKDKKELRKKNTSWEKILIVLNNGVENVEVTILLGYLQVIVHLKKLVMYILVMSVITVVLDLKRSTIYMRLNMKTKNNRQRGKATEKAVAKRINGVRVGIMGGEDIHHPLYSIESKSVSRCVIEKWFEQCEKNNKRKVIPCVIVHIKNKSHDNDYVILKMKDTENIFKEKL
jgi:hypothetical protein